MENVADIYALSPTQLGMMFHSLANEQSGVYVNQYTCQLQGQLQPTAFQQAWQQTIARHPVLRTAFLWDGLDEPLQVVRQQVDLPWQPLDWQGVSEAEQAEKLEAFLVSDRQQGFELEQAPLIRLTLIQLSGDRHQLVWSSHHLLFDGWSLPLIWRDMLAFYKAAIAGTAAQLPTLTPYSDYIAWLQEQDPTAAEPFWRSQLQGVTEPTPLPAARTSAETVAQGYIQQTQQLSPQLTNVLQTLARQNRLTLNTFVQGAWALLLQHYSGNEQVTHGSVVSGRPPSLKGVEQMVGLFINTLPVCTIAKPEQLLLDWLQERQQHLLNLRQYETSRLTDIQKWSDLPPGRSLFESIVVFENYPTAAADDLGFVTQNVRFLEQSNYPLALLVVPGEALELILLYDPNRFEAESIKHLLAYLEHLLVTFVEQPNIPLGDIPRQIPAEQKAQANAQTVTQPQQEHKQAQTIHQLIESQVEKTPEAIAVCYATQELTYSALNQRANQLAHYLRTQGAGPGERVAICLERSVDLVVSVLAVLKAGAAYVPLDPNYPAERIQYCWQDIAPKLLLTQQSVELAIAPETENASLTRLDLDDESIPLEQFPNTNPEANTQPNDLAYIIYTSGSTGNPKGVMVNHSNLVYSTTARNAVYPNTVDTFLLLSSIAFDSSVAGLFWTLCQGGKLVIAPHRIEQDIQQLSQLIDKEAITHTLCVPTLYRLLLEMGNVQRLGNLNTVIVAGEACPRPLAQQHHAKLPSVSLYNEYGPTEATVWCTTYQVPAELPSGSIAIGRAIPNVQLQILDAQQRPMPRGAVGELYIGGLGVAQGYWNQPELTATAFCTVNSQRFYRTGDLVRYRADGCLEWLGRCDRQVKIRGYRIELGEIENALQSHPAVQEVAVVPSQLLDPLEKSQRLLAYVVPQSSLRNDAGDSLDWTELRQDLQSQLPDYMIPASWIEIAALPRNANGKIDAKALPSLQPSSAIAQSARQVQPRTENETILAEIWCEVLGLEIVSIHDHFFELGGDSILSIQIVSMAREAGLSLLPNQLFEHPTVASLATAVASSDKLIPQAEQAEVVGDVSLTPIQRWFFEQKMVAPHHWNQAMLFELSAEVTVEAVKEAIATLWQHHDALRLSFQSSNKGWQQTNKSSASPPQLRQIDVSGLSELEQQQAVALHADKLRDSLNLAEHFLVQPIYFTREAKQPDWLLLDLHHLVVDGVSWQILQQDFATLLSGSSSLPDKTTAFKTWSEFLVEQAPKKQAELDFWLTQLNSPALELPSFGTAKDGNGSAIASSSLTEATAQTIVVALDVEQTQQLLKVVPATYNTQINDALLTALAQTLLQTADTQNGQVRFDLESYGREGLDSSLDLSRTVGWFTTFYPVCLALDGTDLGANLKSVKEQLRQIPDHGIGYGLLRYLGDESVRQQLQAAGSSQILFNYLGQRDRQTNTNSNAYLNPLIDIDLGQLRDPRNARSYAIEINAWVMGEQLQLNWTYDSRLYEASDIMALANRYLQCLNQIICHCTATEDGGFTPSDFPDADLDQSELDDFISQLTQ